MGWMADALVWSVVCTVVCCLVWSVVWAIDICLAHAGRGRDARCPQVQPQYPLFRQDPKGVWDGRGQALEALTEVDHQRPFDDGLIDGMALAESWTLGRRSG